MRPASLCSSCCALTKCVCIIKKTKHEYKFHVFGDPPEVVMCALHPNPAAPIDPRNYRQEARAAAQWFVAKRSASHMPVLGVSRSSGWINV